MVTTSAISPRTTPAPLPRTPLMLGWASAAVIATIFSTLALLRHARFQTTGYDLGIFEQGVRSYAEGRLPTSLLKGVNYPLLGDHFSPITALIAPIYAVIPQAEALLITQALLLAVGVVPLTIWAGRTLGMRAAVVVTASYALAGGLAHAVAFDFHEIAFAVPFLAFSLTALGQRKLRAAAAWAAALVLMKEDLGVTVAGIGVLIAVLGRTRADRRLGVFTGVFGLAATTIATFVLIPAANPVGTNQYTHQLEVDSAWAQATTFLSNPLQITTVVLLLLPTAFIALRSPLVLLTLPTLAWRFLSDNPQYWGTAFHYDAVLVPIATAAFIDGLIRIRRDTAAGGNCEHLVLAVSMVATILLLSVSPLQQLVTPELWQQSAHERTARGILAQIPDGATVAASNSLAPHLTGRAEVSLLGILPLEDTQPEYIVADTSITHQYPLDADDLTALIKTAETDGYRVIAAQDLVFLLTK